MTSKKRSEWKSLDGLLRGLKAQAKRIVTAKQIVPEDLANDPPALIAWIREQERKEKRRRKWR